MIALRLDRMLVEPVKEACLVDPLPSVPRRASQCKDSRALRLDLLRATMRKVARMVSRSRLARMRAAINRETKESQLAAMRVYRLRETRLLRLDTRQALRCKAFKQWPWVNRQDTMSSRVVPSQLATWPEPQTRARLSEMQLPWVTRPDRLIRVNQQLQSVRKLVNLAKASIQFRLDNLRVSTRKAVRQEEPLPLVPPQVRVCSKKMPLQ